MTSVCNSVNQKPHWHSLVWRQALRSSAVVFVTAIGVAGCGAGGSATPGSSAAGSPCYEQQQQSLRTHGTPDEIREDSVTFDDGTQMLIESHVYMDTRLIVSFGHKIDTGGCDQWEEGLTI